MSVKPGRDIDENYRLRYENADLRARLDEAEGRLALMQSEFDDILTHRNELSVERELVVGQITAAREEIGRLSGVIKETLKRLCDYEAKALRRHRHRQDNLGFALELRVEIDAILNKLRSAEALAPQAGKSPPLGSARKAVGWLGHGEHGGVVDIRTKAEKADPTKDNSFPRGGHGSGYEAEG